MMKALVRTPDAFFPPFSGGRDPGLAVHFGRLNMTVDLGLNGRRLSASFNGGHRNTAISSGFYDDCDYEDDVLADDVLAGDVFEVYAEYDSIVNIWWDVGWCPPPLNFDVSKIGMTVIEAMRRIKKTSCPIYLRVYGNSGELLSKMAKNTIKIISESGFKITGIELKDDGGSNLGPDGLRKCYRKKTLMMDDLIYGLETAGTPTKPIHVVILDGKVIKAVDLYQFVEADRCCLICVEPERESVDGIWVWKPLWPVKLSLLTEYCDRNDGLIVWCKDDGLFNDVANINTSENDQIVSIWWDFGSCPLPLNFDTPMIASNITKALRRLNLCGRPIYFHAYGNIQEIGEDIIRFVSDSDIQIVGFRLVDCKGAYISFLTDLEFDSDQRSELVRPPVINIVISNGYRLDFLREDGIIIMPSEVFLDEGSQRGRLPHHMLKDDENIFLEHYMDFEYLVGRWSHDYKRSVNIWWDASRCPPPLNFDVSKSGVTIVEVMRRINTSRSIYLRMYGNRRELLPKMAKDTKRIISESGFKLVGFLVKDSSDVSDFVHEGFQRNRKCFSPVLEENLMMEDLIYYGIRNGAPPEAIHMVVLDGKVITATALDQHRRQFNCCVICLEPEQEAVDGVWRWKPLGFDVA